MKKLLVYVLCIVLLFSLANAEGLTCQYKEEVLVSETTVLSPYFLGKELLPLTVEISNINEGWWQPVRILNPNMVNVLIELKLNVNTQEMQWCASNNYPTNQLVTFNIIVPKLGYIDQEIVRPPISNEHYCKNIRFTEPYSITYLDTEDVSILPKSITTFDEVCKECPDSSGVQCKNDGETCTIGTECGSDICNIAGICGAKNTPAVVL